MKSYNKLVRDKIPEIIKTNGQAANLRKLDEDEYFKALNQKLTEEIAEYFEDYNTEELADVIEVVYAIVKCKGLSLEDFEIIRKRKLDERGGFEDRLMLVEVERREVKCMI